MTFESINNASDPSFADIIANIRTRAGSTPRPFEKNRDQVRMGFIRKLFDRKLAKQVKDSKLLIEQGNIVWGALVQANSRLFKPGSDNCPGDMFYSTDQRMDAQPEVLAECASNLFSIKGDSVGDPELQAFADSLADELGRSNAMSVPAKLTDGIPSIFAVIEFERKHLPNNCISDQIMPILTHPSTESIMVLPHWHWS